MLIECSYCQSRVDAKILCEKSEWDSREDPFPLKVVFVQCPSCSKALLGLSEQVQVGAEEWEWGDATRLWPEPESFLHRSIPGDVRLSLEEARKCFLAKAFSASVVMCGRAIEAMCVAHTKEKTLQKGLQALRDSGIIDGRLFDWGNSICAIDANIGAHATGQKIGMQDARDVLDFATAICEYVYVLSDRYDSYKKRKAEREQKSNDPDS